MAELFDGIPLDAVSTSMTINSTAIILLAMYITPASATASIGALSGTIQNDILKEYLARGTFIYPPHASLRLVTDIFAFCASDLPRWKRVSDERLPHPRGWSDGRAGGRLYARERHRIRIEAGRARGLSAESLGERMSFFFAAHNDFLEEIAKFRAARRMWARVMAGRFGVTNPRAQQLRFQRARPPAAR